MQQTGRKWQIITKIGHRGFVSVLPQIYRSIAKYGFRTLLRRVCTWRVMWLCHKLQISRLTHPFKVSCLWADYTLINLNNENFDGDPTRRHQERRNKRSLFPRLEATVSVSKINIERFHICYTVNN